MQYPYLNQDPENHAASKCLFWWQEGADSERDCSDSEAFVELSQLSEAEFQRHSMSLGFQWFIAACSPCGSWQSWQPSSNNGCCVLNHLFLWTCRSKKQERCFVVIKVTLVRASCPRNVGGETVLI